MIITISVLTRLLITSPGPPSWTVQRKITAARGSPSAHILYNLVPSMLAGYRLEGRSLANLLLSFPFIDMSPLKRRPLTPQSPRWATEGWPPSRRQEPQLGALAVSGLPFINPSSITSAGSLPSAHSEVTTYKGYELPEAVD